MKTPEEYIDDFWGKHSVFNKSDYDVAIVIDNAQKEAWNEAITAAAKSARLNVFDYIGTSFKKSGDWERFSVNDGTYVEIDKESILKLKK